MPVAATGRDAAVWRQCGRAAAVWLKQGSNARQLRQVLLVVVVCCLLLGQQLPHVQQCSCRQPCCSSCCQASSMSHVFMQRDLNSAGRCRLHCLVCCSVISKDQPMAARTCSTLRYEAPSCMPHAACILRMASDFLCCEAWYEPP